MPNEISRPVARPVVQPAKTETTTPRAEALRQVTPEPSRDEFETPAAEPVQLRNDLPQLNVNAPTFNVRGIQVQQSEATQDVGEIRRRASSTTASAADRAAATTELGDLAAAGNRTAIRELSLLRTPEAARELLRAPASSLSASDYTAIVDAGGEDPAVQAQVRARIEAGDAAAIDGVTSAIHARSPNRDSFTPALAAAPAGSLTPRAYEALGKEAGAGNRAAMERLSTEARTGNAGALAGLEAATLHGISPSHRDSARDAIAEAAIENPAAMDTLRRMNETGQSRREVDGVDSYFNATSRLTDPARISSELQSMNQRGKLTDFISTVHPQRLTDGPLRAELMKVALGPPANEAVSRSLSDALRHADFEANSMLNNTGASDIDRARAGVMEEIQRRAETDPDMKQLSDLLQVAHRASTDPEFAARIDQDRLQSQLQTLMEKPSVQATLAEVRAQSDVFNVGDRMASRIESGAYQDRLRLMSPEERQSTLQRDLAQLASVDPVRAQQVGSKIIADQIAADPVGSLASMPAEQREASIASIASNLGVPPAVVGQLTQSILDSRAKGEPIPGLNQLIDSMNLPASQRAALTRAFGTGANAINGFAAAVSAVGLVDAALTGDVMGAISNGAGMSAALSTIFSNSPGALGAAARWGGIVGNGASAVLSGMAAYQEAMRGDYVGAAGNGMMAVGSAALAGSPFTGPAAPTVAVVGAALIGAGWVTNQFSEADYETIARQQGLLR